MIDSSLNYLEECSKLLGILGSDMPSVDSMEKLTLFLKRVVSKLEQFAIQSEADKLNIVQRDKVRQAASKVKDYLE
jgi:thiaminase